MDAEVVPSIQIKAPTVFNFRRGRYKTVKQIIHEIFIDSEKVIKVDFNKRVRIKRDTANISRFFNQD
jgi:hypothetical protein